MKKAILFSLLLIFVFYSCATLRMEKKLTPPVRAWYDTHHIIMEGNVMWWISEKPMSEGKYFLRLSPELQLKYISVFWKIRRVEMEEQFKARVEFAQKFFTDANRWQESDRARIMVVCGYPEEIRPFDKYGRECFCEEPGCIQVWFYTHVGTRYACVFLKTQSEWAYSPNNVAIISEFHRFYNLCLYFWEPFDYGPWEDILKAEAAKKIKNSTKVKSPHK